MRRYSPSSFRMTSQNFELHQSLPSALSIIPKPETLSKPQSPQVSFLLIAETQLSTQLCRDITCTTQLEWLCSQEVVESCSGVVAATEAAGLR